jgi:hypothetical protein
LVLEKRLSVLCCAALVWPSPLFRQRLHLLHPLQRAQAANHLFQSLLQPLEPQPLQPQPLELQPLQLQPLELRQKAGSSLLELLLQVLVLLPLPLLVPVHVFLV